MALPDARETANTILTVSYKIDAWGGFIRAFTDGENWIPQDWTDYNAFSFWLYGSDTGARIQLEIFDNRNSDIDVDSAERWLYRVRDDFEGWRQITIPFEQFQRRSDWQPQGAPHDGPGLDSVHGYAMSFPNGVGAHVAHIDNVGLATLDDTSEVIIISETETGVDP